MLALASLLIFVVLTVLVFSNTLLAFFFLPCFLPFFTFNPELYQKFLCISNSNFVFKLLLLYIVQGKKKCLLLVLRVVVV